MKKTALTTGAVMVLSRGIGFAEEESGSAVIKNPYPTIVTRRFFRPDATMVTPYPATKGTDPNAEDIDTQTTASMTATSAEKDRETVQQGTAHYVGNYNNTGKSGYIYEVTVIISYKNIVP